MNQNFFITLLLILFLTISCQSNKSQFDVPSPKEKENNSMSDPQDLESFPIADIGYKKVYIHVPEENEEENFKIELFIGKSVDVDCNNYFMLGQINEEILDGFGYKYYKIISNGEIAGTKIGCLDNLKTNKFVYIQPKTLEYNSKIPVVIYVPYDFEVKYKIYKSGQLKNAIEKQDSPILGTIKFEQLNRYFIKNNTNFPVKSNKLDTEESFNAVFGMATVMGNDGRPTSINFDQEYVVPIILEETNIETNIEILGVSLVSKGDLLVNYKVIIGKKQSFKIKPFAAIKLNKSNIGNIILNEIK